MAAAGAPAGALRPPPRAGAWDTTTSTRRSTTTAGWPTRRSTPDERGSTCAGFLARAAAFFASHGIERIEAVMSDNAFSYRLSRDFQAALAALGARHILIRPHCPWTNGKVERFNRTLLAEWAYSQVFTSNAQRADRLSDWLSHYNTRRRHSALKGRPPISRLSTTW